jgi:hypothetical protein
MTTTDVNKDCIARQRTTQKFAKDTIHFGTTTHTSCCNHVLKKDLFPISSSKMQKEIQCDVGSGLVLGKLNEQDELSIFNQFKFIYNIFHGGNNNPNSIGLVETIISGTIGLHFF